MHQHLFTVNESAVRGFKRFSLIGPRLEEPPSFSEALRMANLQDGLQGIKVETEDEFSRPQFNYYPDGSIYWFKSILILHKSTFKENIRLQAVAVYFIILFIYLNFVCSRDSQVLKHSKNKMAHLVYYRYVAKKVQSYLDNVLTAMHNASTLYCSLLLQKLTLTKVITKVTVVAAKNVNERYYFVCYYYTDDSTLTFIDELPVSCE